MSHLFLSHLSQNNNRQEIIQNLFSRYDGKAEVVIASRFEETPVYDIDNKRWLCSEAVPVEDNKTEYAIVVVLT